MKRLSVLRIKEQKLLLPAFFPDATKGVVRCLSARDIKETGIKGLIINTFHLMNQPGDQYIQSRGGMKNYMNWQALLASDSGGFQIMSMIHKNQNQGKISKKGVVFKFLTDKGRKTRVFTPEKSIQVQFNLGVDMMISLDCFTRPRASKKEVRQSVDLTIDWAKRSKLEYLRQLKLRKISFLKRPWLLSVIQGGFLKNERKRCAQKLLKIGFDGYGFGGWMLDEKGSLDLEISRFNAQLTPDHKVRFALGIGTPQDIVQCFKLGYHIFDCVLPTRDARHGRLYVLKKDWQRTVKSYLLSDDKRLNKKIFKFFYPAKAGYAQDIKPVSSDCSCLLCQKYSRDYLHHLFKIKESLALRLATTHNLHAFAQLMAWLQKSFV